LDQRANLAGVARRWTGLIQNLALSGGKDGSYAVDELESILLGIEVDV